MYVHVHYFNNNLQQHQISVEGCVGQPVRGTMYTTTFTSTNINNEKALKCKPSLEFRVGTRAQPDKITCKQCMLSRQLVSLVYGNLPTKSLHIVSHITSPYFLPAGTYVPQSEHVSQQYFLHNCS